MRTPAGKECRYFYGNYFRGRSQEECRLIDAAPRPNHWTPNLCKDCPVPGILLANACTNMVLDGKVNRGFLGIGRHVSVSTYCTLSKQFVKEPHVGCGQCHPLPEIFKEPGK